MSLQNASRAVALVMLAASLFACTSTESFRLYPVNDLAAPTGVLIGEYVNRGTGSGPLTVRLPNGEVLQGEYSGLNTSTTSFGSIYSQVSSVSEGATGGTVMSGTGTASGSVTTVKGAKGGVVSLFGNRGTSMQCEYVFGPHSSGSGACRSNSGALYRLYF